MNQSISWQMTYHKRKQDGRDRVGGLPDHLPAIWPRCQLCQEWMQFIGQLYTCERLPIANFLGIQFYICDDCRETFDGQANDRLPIHMDYISPDATANLTRSGVRCREQPLLYIRYTAIEDPMDQWAFSRKGCEDDFPEHQYLFDDKIGGMFPYDGYDAPKITRSNRMMGQFSWKAVGGPIYLYQSRTNNLYLYHYR